MQPEFFAAVQILAGLRRDFADRLVFYGTLKIKHRKIAHLQCALRHIYEIRGLIAQAFDRGFDFCVRNLSVRQLHRNVFVIRKFKLWRGDHSRAEAHRLIFAKFDLLNVSQRSDSQLLLFNRFVITSRHELLREFILNFLAKSLVDHCTRRFSGPVSWNFCESSEAVCDRIPFLRNLVRRQFNL